MSKRTKTRTAGLYKNAAGIYEIDKRIAGRRLAVSTECRALGEAEAVMAELVARHRAASTYGERQPWLFDDVAAEYLRRNITNATIADDAGCIERWLPYLSGIRADAIHPDHAGVASMVLDLKRKKRKAKTINAYLELLRRMLRQAEHWRDDHGLTWIDRAPRFKLLPLDDRREPRVITPDEQTALIEALPAHLADAALLCLNTGLRDWGTCHACFDWVVDTSAGPVLQIQLEHPRQKERGIVPLNTVARGIVQRRREAALTDDGERVITFRGVSVDRIVNSAWRRARKAIGIPDLHFHDLRHTFGYRLRDAGVDWETRRDLMRHATGDVTSHYSAADLEHLFECAERVTKPKGSRPLLKII